MTERERLSPSLWLQRLAWILSLCAAVVWILESRLRYFDQDEFQHLHTISQIGRHRVPYRDFFEHHTPLFHYLSVPILKLIGETPDAPLAFRMVMLGLVGLIVGETAWLTAQLFGRTAAAISALLLLTTVMFVDKGIEIRPEHVAVLLELWALGTISRELGPGGSVSPRRFLLAGLALGLALLANQKAVFTCLGVAAVLVFALFAPGKRRTALVAGLALAGGVGIPLISAVAFFFAQGALSDFIHFAGVFNLGFKWRGYGFFAHGGGSSAYDVAYRLFAQNAFLVCFAAAGTAVAVRESWTSARRLQVLSLVLPLMALCAGLFLQAQPWSQFWMRCIPLLCAFAAPLVERVALWEWPSSGLKSLFRTGSAVYLLALGLAAIGVCWLVKWGSFSGLTRPWLGFALLGAGAFAAALGSRRGTVLAVVLGFVAFPMDVMVGQLAQLRPAWTSIGPSGGPLVVAINRNDTRLAALRSVMERTQPEDRVLDGTSGLGAFREHTYFYWHLNVAIRELLTKDQLGSELLQAIRERPPKVLIIDPNTQPLGPEVRALATQLGAMEVDVPW